ncbi:Poly(ADP-ribose) glycohydrolase [Papilio xuthus]|uniref:poly(ADP-ribose) glycohydrolase n=1 Tax=Papilio xuthus TaxID=66420 RepID=A0A194PU76_PAPXU|nr:Poly(ADP-ribose) glycohydrolase [Papilio xuthus]
MSSGNYWKGAPLSMLYGSESPWDNPGFPPVQPGHNHAVLYHIPSNGVLADDRPPKPQVGQDKWDQHHVRLPCSKHSLYPVTDDKGETRLRKRWAIIVDTLKKPIRNSHELADAILAYNTKFKNRWKFRALHKLFNECLEEEESQSFFDVTLPEIVKLVLDLPKLIQAPIPLLKQHKNMSISLSQQQISSLLANAFFCTFPRRNSMKPDSEYSSYPFINFNTLYETSGSDDVIEKLKCICHYFRRVYTEVPCGVVTYSRRSVPPRALPRWRDSTKSLALPLHLNPVDTIEDADGLIQVDFANKYLGGGVLGHGCVQEEIRFVICPELMASMLFTELLRPNEAVMIIGGERYSRYAGYGHTFEWAGPWAERAPRDCSARRRQALLAIDALLYDCARHEFRKEAITRELNKAWVGFSFYTSENTEGMEYPGVATGNWGCGAFGGSAHLKSLLQLMACAQAQRPMAYYTFRDNKLADDIHAIYTQLVNYNVTVGQLYQILLDFCEEGLPPSRLHRYIVQQLTGVAATPTATPSATPTTTPTVTDSTESETRDDLYMSDSVVTECFNSPFVFHMNTQEKLLEDQQADTNKNLEKPKQTSDDKMDTDDKTPSDNKMESDNKMAANSSDLTSRLFQEMEKLDEGNGSLNFSRPHTLPLSQSSQSASGDADTKRSSMDLSMDVKKKISKKITDYFSKKSI